MLLDDCQFTRWLHTIRCTSPEVLSRGGSQKIWSQRCARLISVAKADDSSLALLQNALAYSLLLISEHFRALCPSFERRVPHWLIQVPQRNALGLRQVTAKTRTRA